MNDCLVKKYKAVVNNDNLVKLYEVKFHVKNTNTTNILAFGVKGANSLTATIIGNGYFYDGDIDNPTVIGKTMTGADLSGYRLSTGEYDVVIKSKYDITAMTLSCTGDGVTTNFDLSMLEYSNNSESFILRNCGISGKAENLTALSESAYNFLSGLNIVGDVKYLAQVTLIDSTNISSVSAFLSGSIEDFVANLKSDNYSKSFETDAEQFTFNGMDSLSATITVDSGGNATVKYGTTLKGTYTKATNTWVYE